MTAKALQLSDEMQQQGLQPNVITYSAVVSACGKCEIPERALQLFDEMQQQGLEPNVIIYTAVIGAGRLTCSSSSSCGSKDASQM